MNEATVGAMYSQLLCINLGCYGLATNGFQILTLLEKKNPKKMAHYHHKDILERTLFTYNGNFKKCN